MYAPASRGRTRNCTSICSRWMARRPRDCEALGRRSALHVLMRLANEADFDKDKVGYVNFVDNRVATPACVATVRHAQASWKSRADS